MEPITIDRKESRRRVAPEWVDVCFTCGTCIDGPDPRGFGLRKRDYYYKAI